MLHNSPDLTNHRTSYVSSYRAPSNILSLFVFIPSPTSHKNPKVSLLMNSVFLSVDETVFSWIALLTHLFSLSDNQQLPPAPKVCIPSKSSACFSFIFNFV